MKKFFVSTFLVIAILFANKSEAQFVAGAHIGFGIPIPVPPHRPYYVPSPAIYAAPAPYYGYGHRPVYRRYVPNCYRERHYWRSGRRW